MVYPFWKKWGNLCNTFPDGFCDCLWPLIILFVRRNKFSCLRCEINSLYPRLGRKPCSTSPIDRINLLELGRESFFEQSSSFSTWQAQHPVPRFGRRKRRVWRTNSGSGKSKSSSRSSSSSSSSSSSGAGSESKRQKKRTRFLHDEAPQVEEEAKRKERQQQILKTFRSSQTAVVISYTDGHELTTNRSKISTLTSATSKVVVNSARKKTVISVVGAREIRRRSLDKDPRELPGIVSVAKRTTSELWWTRRVYSKFDVSSKRTTLTSLESSLSGEILGVYLSKVIRNWYGTSSYEWK